jgi:GNAT superfamily N-acetyltransferase
MIASHTINSAASTIPIRIGAVSADETIGLIPELMEVLRNSVSEGGSLGFLPPVSQTTARNYWLSVLPDIRSGSRILLVAVAPDRIIGSAQLALPFFATALHRATVEKVFVDPASRGQGVGTLLMEEIHELARLHGRSLLLLGSRKGGGAEGFYRRLGYREAGVVPGFTWGGNGSVYDQITFYLDLGVGGGTRALVRRQA